MKFILPMNPMDSRQPDFGFEDEYNTLRLLGADVLLFDMDKFLNADDLWLRPFDILDEPTRVVYRGWMMTDNQYCKFYRALLSRNWKLLNTPAEYDMVHYFPFAYSTSDTLRKFSPKTYSIYGRDFFPEDIYKFFDGKPYIVKDYVKSAKAGDSSLVVTDPSNFDEANSVVESMLEIRDMYGFNKGLVFKEFIDFARDRNGNIYEYRAFIVNNRIVIVSENGCLGDRKFDTPWGLIEIAKELPSNFMTIDFALGVNNRYYIVETGAGSVSGLATGMNPLAFYNALMKEL